MTSCLLAWQLSHGVPIALVALPRVWPPRSKPGQLENHNSETIPSCPLASDQQLLSVASRSTARTSHLLLLALAPHILKHQAGEAMHHHGAINFIEF